MGEARWSSWTSDGGGGKVVKLGRDGGQGGGSRTGEGMVGDVRQSNWGRDGGEDDLARICIQGRGM